MVVDANHVDVSDAIHFHSPRSIELAVPAADRAPFRQKGPLAVELLDAIVADLSEVDIPSIHRHICWDFELAVPLPNVPHFARKVPWLLNF